MDLTALPMMGANFLTGTLLPFLFVLTVIVFFHELGHFLVARWNKVTVEAFAVGFGPEIVGFTDRKGTRWKFCAIPLGGYVKFLGDRDAASTPDHEQLASLSGREREGAFENKALWRKALVVAAGPIANFLLAIVIYTALFMNFSDVRLDPVVGAVTPGSAAEAAGFQVDDRIVQLNGEPVSRFSQIRDTTIMNSDAPLQFVVERGGERLDILATPRITEQTDRFGNTFKVALIGIASKSGEEFTTVQSLGPVAAFQKALDRTGTVTMGTLNFLRELVLGKQDASELRGPIGIGQVTSQVATLGIWQLMSLAGVISISIGLLNLFPIPMLDGGHLLFYAIEAVRGKAMSPKTMEMAYRVGMVCVLGLMVFATSNDLLRIFSS